MKNACETPHAALVRRREQLRAEQSRRLTTLTAQFTKWKETAGRAQQLLSDAREVLAKPQVRSPWPDEALREQRALAGLAAVLASTLDYESTLSQLVALIAEDLGDIAVLYVCEGDSVAHRVRVANRDPSTAWYWHQIQDIRGDASPEHPVARVIASRQPLLVTAAASVLDSLAHSREHAVALSALGLRSIMAVPLVIADRSVGALLLKSVTRVYAESDLRFAQEVAQRTALLIENARLHQTAQQAIQARDDMLGVVAHDLRNPLAAILLEASFLARGGEQRRVDVRESAAAIQDAARFMKRLIDDLLDAERIRCGRLSVDRSRVAVAATIAEFVRVQKPILAASRLELRVDIADRVNDVDVDHDRLLQVLENLVGNAELSRRMEVG